MHIQFKLSALFITFSPPALQARQGEPGKVGECDSEEQSDDTNDEKTSGSSSSEPGDRRSRSVIRQDQLEILRTFYHLNPLPSAQDLAKIGAAVALAPKVVRVWFQNARSRDRKQGKEIQSTGLSLPSPPTSGVANNVIHNLKIIQNVGLLPHSLFPPTPATSTASLGPCYPSLYPPPPPPPPPPPQAVPTTTGGPPPLSWFQLHTPWTQISPSNSTTSPPMASPASQEPQAEPIDLSMKRPEPAHGANGFVTGPRAFLPMLGPASSPDGRLGTEGGEVLNLSVKSEDHEMEDYRSASGSASDGDHFDSSIGSSAMSFHLPEDGGDAKVR